MPFPAGPPATPDSGSGLCEPWIGAADVQARPGCGSLSDPDATSAALIASELLYAMSGRQFSGGCTATIRPTATPCGMSLPAWAALNGGYLSPGAGSWGTCTTNSLDHRSCVQPAEILLGAYPVTGIIAVKIDGTVIPSDEYALRSRRTLVRLRTSANTQPTGRPGFPCCQSLDLPDTEPGTFSVTLTYGVSPPESGRYAAAVLAGEIGLEEAGQGTGKLPARVQELARQGVSIRVGDPLPSLDKGLTGIPAVDRFLVSVNPHRLIRRPQVWTPDVGRARRT